MTRSNLLDTRSAEEQRVVVLPLPEREPFHPHCVVDGADPVEIGGQPPLSVGHGHQLDAVAETPVVPPHLTVDGTVRGDDGGHGASARHQRSRETVVVHEVRIDLLDDVGQFRGVGDLGKHLTEPALVRLVVGRHEIGRCPVTPDADEGDVETLKAELFDEIAAHGFDAAVRGGRQLEPRGSDHGYSQWTHDRPIPPV